MRRLSPILAMFAAALLFLSLGFGPQEKDQRAAAGEARTQAQTALNIEPYAPDPNHIWNRLFHLFYVRTAPNGRQYGGDELDPYLWQQTQYLLTGPSHGDALKLLNEFLDQHAERLITDPLPRALLQCDLWAVHDWLAIPYTEHQREREQLRKPVAEIIQRLALTEEQIRALPDNYAAAVQSKTFPDRYNPGLPDTPFLPDLFRAGGPWVCLGDQQGRVLPVLHLQEFRGRSAFLVFLRLPGERVEALAYLEKLRSIPSVWAPIPGSP
ncbi:MAG TPA: hypothetical protein VEW69_12405, partial [Alphaproteobacteria bacterium]|nr:hypothetical protein [Alphaproteobacteria bacterium]